MPPSSRTTMRLDCARANLSTAGAPSAPNAATPCRMRRREGWENESSVMVAPGSASGRRRGRRQQPPGVEQVVGVEQPLDAAHHVDLDLRLEERHFLCELLADAVLRAERAAERVRDFVDGALDAVRDGLGVVERLPLVEARERDEMDVAVAEVGD